MFDLGTDHLQLASHKQFANWSTLVQEPASIQHPQLSPPANRVSTLTPASIQFLTDIGAWPDIAPPRSAPFSRMQVWDSTGSGFVQYDAATASEVTMGHVAENGVIQYALMQRLRPNVHNMWPVSVHVDSHCRQSALVQHTFLLLHKPSLDIDSCNVSRHANAAFI